ncbi:MAG: AAA family ATPase [Candidatus Eremiobacteraeota bacterium]|nr:AAA family ATPase [Candidatus Eremiobacteraeota bacterium]
MDRLNIRLLGEPAVLFDGEPWKWSAPPRCFPLLALLALARDVAPTRASLASTMWPDEMEADARSNLRRHLHRLVRALPAVEGVEWVCGDERSIAWNDRSPASIDVRTFDDAVRDPLRRAEAVELYHGDLLEGFFDEYILAERERLRALYVEALSDLTAQARARRDLSAAVRFSERLLAADEWREDALRQWMAAKYESGDRSGALAGYERFARRLRDEFSTDPMPETVAVRDAVRAGLPLPDDAEHVLEARVAGVSGWKLPMVGRSHELEKLRAAWSRAARKSGSVAFVSGEAGIGKSRLISELVTVVREQGGHALIGATSNPEAEPYQAILSALRTGLPKIAQANVDRRSLAALSAVLPELHNLRPDVADAEPSPNDRARERLFESFVRAIAQLGGMRPLCVVLEDLHWAGPASIEVVAALARRVGTLPVLVVASYRSEESPVGNPLRELRAELVSERRAIAVPLERLTAQDVGSVVQTVAPEATGGLTEAVARLSEGNPLFVVQLLAGYRETGEMPDESVALQTVGDVIGTRAKRLDDVARAVAETAAVLGQAFEADVVADIGGWDENTVLDAVGTLIDRSLVREAGSGSLEYAFTHALVAASFYEGSNADQRVARHRRAAHVLERRGTLDRALLAAVARHWNLAGDGTRAAVAYVKAAVAALAVYAREEAIALAYAAYALAQDDPTRFEAMEIAVRAQIRTGDAQRWKADLDRLDAITARLGEQERFAALKLRERYAAQFGDYAMERKVVDAMFEQAKKSGNLAHAGEAYYALGYLQGATGDVAASIASMRQARDLARRVNDDDLRVRIGQQLVSMLGRRGDLEQARAELAVYREDLEKEAAPVDRKLALLTSESTVAAMLEDGTWLERIGTEMLALARGIGDEFLEARAYSTLGHAAYMLHDFASIRKHYDRAVEIFAAVASLRDLRVTYINRSELELRLGRVDEAMRWLDQAVSHGGQLAGSDGVSAYRVNRIEALLLLGRNEEALAEARETYASSLEVSEKRFIDQALTVLGAAEAATGRFGAAIDHLRQALEGAKVREAWGDVGLTLCYLVDALLDSGRAGEALALRSEIEEAFRLHERLMIHPTQLCATVARLAESSGDEAAAGHWRRRGLALLEADLARMTDPADAAAYSALPFHRALREVIAAPGSDR